MKIRIPEYPVSSEKIPEEMEGFRLAVLADLHDDTRLLDSGLTEKALKEACPEAVLILGDMITEIRGGVCAGRAARFVRELAADFPVYYAMGNHETRWRLGESTHALKFSRYRRMLERAGVVFLDNRSAVLSRGGEGVQLTGLELPLAYYHRRGTPELTAAAVNEMAGEADSCRYTILAAHSPQFFQTYADWGADLTVSGHFHGGTVRLPIVGGVISPYLQMFPTCDRGIYSLGDSRMIVSAGLGVHTLLFRFNNPPDMPVIVLHHQKG